MNMEFPHWRFAMTVLTLCVGLAVSVGSIKGEEPYSIWVMPAEFFSGELKRLEAHFDFAGVACFTIRKKGPVRCRPDVEVWCDGERVDLRKYGYELDDASREISFTLRRAESRTDGIQYRAGVGGARKFVRLLDEPTSRQKYDTNFGPVVLGVPIELGPKRDSVIVWARGGGLGIDLRQPGKAAEQLKKQPWAIILRLSVEKKKE